MTSELRQDRSQRYNVADDSAPGQEGWSRLILGRPSGADPLRVSSSGPAVTFSPEVTPGRRRSIPTGLPLPRDRVHRVRIERGPRQDLPGALRSAPAGRRRRGWRPTTNSPAPTTSARARSSAPGSGRAVPRARGRRESAPGRQGQARELHLAPRHLEHAGRLLAAPPSVPPELRILRASRSAPRCCRSIPGSARGAHREVVGRHRALQLLEAHRRELEEGLDELEAVPAPLVVQEPSEHAVVQHSEVGEGLDVDEPPGADPAPPPRASRPRALTAPPLRPTCNEASASAWVTRGRKFASPSTASSRATPPTTAPVDGA